MTSLMITEADYPEGYLCKKHPEDGIVKKTPIPPMAFLNRKLGHSRLFLRISFQLSPKRFVPFTFVCDTGVPNYLYLFRLPYRILESRIMDDFDTESRYMIIAGRKVKVQEIPSHHDGSNIMGLMLLLRFGVTMRDAHFDFEELPEFF